mgnify:CR=1 FL=1
MDKDDDQKEGETKGAQKSKDGVDAVGRAASANAAIAVEDMDAQDEAATTAAAETKRRERVNFIRASLAAVRKIERELAAKRRTLTDPSSSFQPLARSARIAVTAFEQKFKEKSSAGGDDGQQSKSRRAFAAVTTPALRSASAAPRWQRAA